MYEMYWRTGLKMTPVNDVYIKISNVLQDRFKDELILLLLFTLVYLYIVLQDRFKDDPSLLLMFTMISKFFLDELNLTWTNTEEIHHIVGKNTVLFYIFFDQFDLIYY